MATVADRVVRADGYGRSTRFYAIGGRRYPSVTAILQAVNKPALIPWAAKEERSMVYRTVEKLIADPDVRRNNFMSSLEAAVGREKAHSKLLAKAATIGSECHELIEWHIRRELKQAVGPEPKPSEKALWAFMAYEDWRKRANLSVTMIEQVVYSKRYGYAGTLDWCGEIDHDSKRVVVVGDFKTAKGIFPEMRLQVAAYGHALTEMGYADVLPGGCIVRLPKDEATPEPEIVVIDAEQMKRLHKVFLNVLELWLWLDEAKTEA